MNGDPPPLPHGFRVHLRGDTERHPGAAPGEIVLVGGSPTRAMRLAPRAAAMVGDGTLTVTDAASALLARRLLDGNLADPPVARASIGGPPSGLPTIGAPPVGGLSTDRPIVDRPPVGHPPFARAPAGEPAVGAPATARPPSGDPQVGNTPVGRPSAGEPTVEDERDGVPGADPITPGVLTVVVPARDRPAQLERCLAALDGLRVVVVDDASRHPATVREVAARHGAELVALPRNLGPAGARNAGLDRVRTPFVAFVDSDVTADAAMLCALAAHLADPAVALAGPLVRGTTRSAQPRWYERVDAGASSLALGERPCSVAVGAAVGWLPSACLVARTAALRDLDVPGFDPSLRVGEDVDLVWRLLARGHRVRYEPRLEARHDVRGTLPGILRRKFVYGTGGADLGARHGAAVSVARLSPAMVLAGAGVLLGRPWSLTVSGVTTAWTARSVYRALPPFDGRGRVAARLALRGLGWSVRQQAALLLRHWWPAALPAAAVSPAVRRMLVSALAVDTVMSRTVDRPIRRPDLPPATGVEILVGRRLDDLAYGLGLWVGAIRGRSPSALRATIVRTAGAAKGLRDRPDRLRRRRTRPGQPGTRTTSRQASLSGGRRRPNTPGASATH